MNLSRLLIVSDNDIVTDLAEPLRDKGFDVAIASHNLEAAQTHTRKKLPHFILLDTEDTFSSAINDPIFRDLRMTTRTTKIPFILLTQKSELQDTPLSRPHDVYVLKPVSLEKCSVAIEQIDTYMMAQAAFERTLYGYNQRSTLAHFPLDYEHLGDLKELLGDTRLWTYIDVRFDSFGIDAERFVRWQMTTALADLLTPDDLLGRGHKSWGNYYIVTFSNHVETIVEAIRQRIAKETEAHITYLEREYGKGQIERRDLSVKIKTISNATHRFTSVEDLWSQVEDQSS